MTPDLKPQISETDSHSIAAMFDRIAPRYDLLNRLLSAYQDQRWRKNLIKRLPYLEQGSLLDVATGTGDILLMAARRKVEYKEFVGVDISKEMLAVAETKKVHTTRASSISFKQMSAEKLVFPDQSFDCLTIAFGLRNVSDRKKALDEFFRVLKKNGRFFILEFFPQTQGLKAQLFDFYFKRILPFIGGLISDPKAYEYLPASVSRFLPKEDFIAFAKECGFRLSFEKTYLFGACELLEFEKIQ